MNSVKIIYYKSVGLKNSCKNNYLKKSQKAESGALRLQAVKLYCKQRENYCLRVVKKL